MANTDNAWGLMPVRYVSGAPYNGATNAYVVPATDNVATYVGGLVKLAGDAVAVGDTYLPTVTSNVATGNPVIGVVVSVMPAVSTDLNYRAASTQRIVNVADDPNLMFEVQVSGTLTSTMVGNVCDATAIQTGSTVTGRSNTKALLSSVSASGDATEDFLILGLVKRIGNEIGANAKVYVRLNNHALVDGTAGQ